MSRKKIIALTITAIIMVFFATYFFFARTPNTTNSNSNQMSLVVKNPGNTEEIKQSFETFKTTAIPEDLRWVKFIDNQNQPLLLDGFSRAVGLTLNTNLNNLIALNKWQLFSCSSAARTRVFGIALEIKLLPEYVGNLYQDEVKIMKNWEGSIFQDTAKIIFSDIIFSPEQLQQKLIFKDGEYRYADISLPDGETASLNYALVDDYIAIAASKECLGMAISELFSITD